MKNTDEPGNYVICINGHLGEYWAARFEGLSITLTEDGETWLTGKVVDQAALHSILRTIRDSGLELISVNRLESD
jgi:hypothetical protein